MKLKWLIKTTAIELLIVFALIGLASHDGVVGAPDEGVKIKGLAGFITRISEQAELSPEVPMDWKARGEFAYSMPPATGTYQVTTSKTGYATKNTREVIHGASKVRIEDFKLIYQGQWQSGPEMCFDLTRSDAEYYPGTDLIYILGGRQGSDSSSTTGDIFSFDPATGECRNTEEDMPEPIANYTISLVNDGTKDLLCTFGGTLNSGISTSSVQCYDPIANSASVVTSLPAAYTGYIPGGQAAVANRVYLFGGFRNDPAPYGLGRSDRYNPINHSFTQIGNLSLARGYIDSAVVDGSIFAFGGTIYDGSSLIAQTRTEVMADPGGDGTWDNAAVAELPTATAEGRAFGYDTVSAYTLAGKIVIAGGGQLPEPTADAFTYDTVTHSYDQTFPDLIDARRDHASAFVPGDTVSRTPGKMWVFGGGQGGESPPYMPSEYFDVALSNVDMSLSPGSLLVSITPNYEMSVPLRITNTGNAALNWALNESTSLMEEQMITFTQPAGFEARPITLTLEANQIDAPAAHAPNLPESSISLIVDDGTNENDIGSETGTSQILWANRFTPAAADFPFQLNQIQVYFSEAGNLDVGDDIVLVVYENLTASADPAVGSTYMAAFPTTIKAIDSWNVYDLPMPVKFFGPGDVIIGVLGWETPGTDYLPASLDMTTSQSRSWIGWWNVVPAPLPPTLPTPSWYLIDTWYPGNWMVRGVGETLTDVPWLSEDVSTGTIQPGETALVQVSFDSHGLDFGDYFARLYFHSNDTDHPVVYLNVKMTVELANIYIPITYR